jgi:zinc protease
MTTTQEAQLDNGLRVILKEVHAAPVISTWMWYRVGSRDEVEGATGVSHWVEHMMFKGSPKFAKGSIMRAVDRRGGYVNAMTSSDFTAYYATLPAPAAELALDIEADRMLGAVFDPTEVEAERTVVIAEREGSENEPRYLLGEELTATAFRVHPYHHQTIGWKGDLQRLTRDQLYAHYRRYYMPNNAVLVIVGDFQADTYFDLVGRYFGGLPSGELPPRLAPQEPPQRGEKRVTLRMPGSAPLLRLAYHTPEVAHPDFIPLVLVDALLSGGKAMFAFGDSPARSARLYRALVDTQLSSSAGSSYNPSLDPYLLSLGATVRNGRQPEEVERAMLVEIARLQEEAVQDGELAVAIRQTQAQFAYSAESVTGQALTLGFLEMVDHHQRLDSVLDELAAVTPADVQRVARTYLGEDNRVLGWFLPTGPGGGVDEDGPAASYRRSEYRPIWFLSGAASSHGINPDTVLRRRLDNGVTVLVKENPTSPSLSIEGRLLAGAIYDDDATAGLASFTASMLRRGTRRHSFQEINMALDNVGASLGSSAGLNDMGFSGQALADDFDLLVDLLAEMLTEPAFPDLEREKLRGQTLTHLGILDSDTGYCADRAFMSALYPVGHPYCRSSLGTRDTVGAFRDQDLAAFYQANYHPGTLLVSVAGAVRAARVLDKLAATLGQWRMPGGPRPLTIPDAVTPPQIGSKRVNLPEKSQVDMIWGVVAMPRTSPDYYAAMMGNFILGRLGLMGRLGDNVRDKQGLAYYVASSLHVGMGPQPWNIVAGVSPDFVDRALASILYEVQRLRDEPVSDEELEDCRSYLLGALPLRLETNEGIADFLLSIEEFGLGLDYLQRYPAIIGGVSKEDIQRMGRKYLTLDHYIVSMAGTFS